jgi:hypothetical protein
MFDIKKLIADLKDLEPTKAFCRYSKQVEQVLKEYGFKFYDSGSFTKVYVGPGKHVVKLCYSKDSHFHNTYPDGYLQPIFISQNRWLAIQPKARTYDNVCNEISRYQMDANYIDRKITALKLRRDAIIKKLALSEADVKKFKVGKVKNHHKITDLRDRNMGILDNEVYMIDLNNHVDTPFVGDHPNTLTHVS